MVPNITNEHAALGHNIDGLAVNYSISNTDVLEIP